MARHVQLAKAKPTIANVQDAWIRIGPEETPEFSSEAYMLEYAEYYQLQAQQLEAALIDTLPGGTYDALLRAMLERRASQLRVRFMREV